MNRYLLMTACLLFSTVSLSQNNDIDIFADDKPLEVTIATDYKQLIRNKEKEAYQNALFTCKLPDSSIVSEEILIRTRGGFRKDNCSMPSLRLNFRTPKSPRLAFLKELKLVNTCDNARNYDQLLIKEYLVYKIYNLLTDTSFRVRLLNITYNDILNKQKPFKQFAFLIEDVDAMAKRNACKEIELKNIHNETTNRRQMTLINLFQYMIGNNDWSIVYNHNMKLIRSRQDSFAIPVSVPYDFDFGGLVNAEYATPPENLPIESVRDRYYRGYSRTEEELQEAIKTFNDKKSAIYSLINGCTYLNSYHKKDMIGYLDEFYKVINDRRAAKRVFIDNAIK